MKDRRAPLWLPPLLVLAWRLAQLGKIEFVNPDSATYLRYDLLVLTQRLPLYPMLVNLLAQLGIVDFTAGKLVAALGAAGAVWLVSLTAVEAGLSPRDAWWAGLLLAINPIFTMVTSQALTEGLFLCNSAAAFLFALRFFRRRTGFDLFLLIFAAGLAGLTRAEGLVFLPVLAVALFVAVRPPGRRREVIPALFGLVPWILLIVWYMAIVRRGGYFREFLLSLKTWDGQDWLFDVLRLLGAVIFQTILIGGFFAIHGWLCLRRSADPEAKIARRLVLYLFLGSWLGVSLHWYFDWRISITLAFWWCVPFAASLAAWRQKPAPVRQWVYLLSAVMSAVGVFLGLVLIDQSADLNRDGRAAAALIRELPDAPPIHADEQAMLSYHLGRIVWPYHRGLMDKRLVVVLSDRLSDLEAERAALEENYLVEELGRFANGREKRPQRTVVWRAARRSVDDRASPIIF